MAELLPWHQRQWETMARTLVAARLPHALLLHGPAGVGKHRFVEFLVQSLLCVEPREDRAPCGRCRGCHLLSAAAHPDFLGVRPVETGKPIRISQVRELADFLGYTGQFGGFKIVVLDPADAMNLNAANGLLKILEEPPPNCALLLVTSLPDRLPATVRSRCQRLAFCIPGEAEAMAWLAARLRKPAEASMLLKVAGGAPLMALALADGGRVERRKQLFDGFYGTRLGKVDPVCAAEDWVTGDIKEHLRWLISWHMDMIRLKMAPSSPRLTNPDMAARLRRLALEQSNQSLFAGLDSAMRLLQLTTTQVNLQLMIEAFFSDCPDV